MERNITYRSRNSFWKMLGQSLKHFNIGAAIFTATAGQCTLAAVDTYSDTTTTTAADEITGMPVLDVVIKIVLPLITGTLVPLFKEIFKDRAAAREERRQERKLRELELMAQQEQNRTTDADTTRRQAEQQ